MSIKHSVLTMAMIVLPATCMATAAYAGNQAVENALRDDPNVSLFYQGLVNTGVLAELKENESYTVFAPTNDSFAQFPPSRYPCFYSQECRGQAAQILRNHIVAGEKNLADLGDHVGGIMSMFSINDYHLRGSEPYRNNYSIDGHKILSEQQFSGGVLYRVDGVLATHGEMAQFTVPTVAETEMPHDALPPRVPEGVIETITPE